MKCAHYQNRKKSKLSTEGRKQLSKIVNNFMANSIVVGPDKALEIMKSKQTNQENKEEE